MQQLHTEGSSVVQVLSLNKSTRTVKWIQYILKSPAHLLEKLTHMQRWKVIANLYVYKQKFNSELPTYQY